MFQRRLNAKFEGSPDMKERFTTSMNKRRRRSTASDFDGNINKRRIQGKFCDDNFVQKLDKLKNLKASNLKEMKKEIKIKKMKQTEEFSILKLLKKVIFSFKNVALFPAEFLLYLT